MDTIELPAHLIALRETWRGEAERLRVDIAPLLPHCFEPPSPQHYRRFQTWNRQQTAALKAWVERIVAWFREPLAQALDDPSASASSMQRTAVQLGCFVNELLDYRASLRAIVHDPALRGAAPWVDTACLVLLEQLRDFIAAVVGALEPGALAAARAASGKDRIELDFRFRPDIAVPMANYAAWLRHVHEIRGGEGHAVTAPAAPPTVPWYVNALTVVLLSALVAVLFWLGPLSWLLLLGIALLVFIVRHPLLAILAFLIGSC